MRVVLSMIVGCSQSGLAIACSISLWNVRYVLKTLPRSARLSTARLALGNVSSHNGLLSGIRADFGP